MSPASDQFDRHLLARLEAGVPLVRRPFDQIAAELGCRRQDILNRLDTLRRPGGIIREISGIFDAQVLGYTQSLVAMKVPAGRLDQAGRCAAGHPGVSHCYGRESQFNLWLTLAVSPGSRLGFERTVELLARLCEASAKLVLPAVKRYKLRVRFADTDEPRGGQFDDSPVAARPALAPTELQVRSIRALQQDLPGQAEPFSALADQAGMDADELLVGAADFIAAGYLRRYAAVLYHRAAGAVENVMVAWRVTQAGADAAGAVCSRIVQISHCYLRQATADWPYNFYTMIHGRSRGECVQTVQQIAIETGLTERAMLWTAKEYKKRRILLFSDEERVWEDDHAERS